MFNYISLILIQIIKMITLNELNSSRQTNYIIIFILLIIFTGSIVSIKYIYGDTTKKEEKEENKTNDENKDTDKNKEENTNDENTDSTLKQWARFLIHLFAMGAFFVACCIISKIIVNGNHPLLDAPRDQF